MPRNPSPLRAICLTPAAHRAWAQPSPQLGTTMGTTTGRLRTVQTTHIRPRSVHRSPHPVLHTTPRLPTWANEPRPHNSQRLLLRLDKRSLLEEQKKKRRPWKMGTNPPASPWPDMTRGGPRLYRGDPHIRSARAAGLHVGRLRPVSGPERRCGAQMHRHVDTLYVGGPATATVRARLAPRGDPAGGRLSSFELRRLGPSKGWAP